MHVQITGEILDVKLDESASTDTGKPDIEKIKPFTYDPAAISYHAIGKNLGRAFNLGKKFK